ncbi:MAG: hypothetical protein JWR22_3735 [Herminiimonas sp.]|nr:hypothetical protein [Herminiimonas sp.]
MRQGVSVPLAIGALRCVSQAPFFIMDLSIVASLPALFSLSEF